MAVVIELVEDVRARPLMLYWASAATWVWLRFLPTPAPAVGSNAIRDRPAVSVLVPSASATVILNALVVPVLLEDSTRRLPALSVTTEAVTPAEAPLIAAATPARVLLDASIVTFSGVEPAVAVKLLPAALYVPSWIVS